MQLIEILLSLAVLWRVLIGTVVGAVAGAVALTAVPSLGAAAVFAGAFFGASAGVVWLATVTEATTPTAQRSMSAGSRVVLLGAVWALGILWGNLLEAVFNVWVSALLLALATPLLALLFFRLTGQRVAPVGQALAVLALLLGLSFSHVSGWGYGERASNPSIERTPSGKLRLPTVAAHVER